MPPDARRPPPPCAPAWTSSDGLRRSSARGPSTVRKSSSKPPAARRNPFTDAEVEAALAHHPRIGERAAGNSAEARLSQSEQATLGTPDPAVAAAIAEGNRSYEEKFGQVFLIRAAGRSREEILAALNARLAHTPEEEQLVIGQQLREIAVLRLEGLIGA